MSKIEVDTIEPQSGTTVTLGASGDTITVPSGTTLNVSSATLSGITQGITIADQWRLSASANSGTDADVTSNWERNDTTGYGKIGTGLSESSGIFSFPLTGVYLIIFSPVLEIASGDSFADVYMKITTDNSTYNNAIRIKLGNRPTSGDTRVSPTNTFIFNVTNITNDKFKFTTSDFATNTVLLGATDSNRTSFSAIRLGDSV